MLIVDGVKYKLWTPADEEKEFHPMIKDHSKDIFGEDSLYFDVKHTLRSRSGIGSIPDAYAISLSKPPKWYIVENELSTHPVYSHVVPQISKFISGIENLRSQREIRDVLYEEITRDAVRKASVEKMIAPEEIHHFLSSLISEPPKIAIIIDEVTEEVREASKALRRLGQTEVVEFKTFVREDAENIRAHLFRPIRISPKLKSKQRELLVEAKTTESKPGDTLELKINTPSYRKYALFYIPKKHRGFFPGYKVDFSLETDIGVIKTRVTGAKAGTPIGDPVGGAYVQGGLREWYNKHQELIVGRKVRFECIEPHKRYRLLVV